MKMNKIFKKGTALLLALIMVMTLMPVTAYAAVDASGRPTNLDNKLILSIYIGEGFPGEPAFHDSKDYVNINSKFEKRSGDFASKAVGELDPAIYDKLVEGASSSNKTVWGVFDAQGMKDAGYFSPDSSIIKPKNEAAIIRAVKGGDLKNQSDDEVLAQYEIIWYVIKLQTTTIWNRKTSEWHIDGIIKEKETVSINYYGNGNTSGSAPDGEANHEKGKSYTVLGNVGNMVKTSGGTNMEFLGWNTKADGKGTTYLPGAVIDNLTENISLYAMWNSVSRYTATVNTYLNGVLTSDNDIHNSAANRELLLSADGEKFYSLSEKSTGVYTTQVIGNGTFYIYEKNVGGNPTKIYNNPLTIYNQNASLNLHHYSVTYDPNGGSFDSGSQTSVYCYGATVKATSDVPTKDGYIFLGWKVGGEGALIKGGETATASLTGPITLTAQWEKTVNVTINVTIDHNGGDGYDQMGTKDDVFMSLVSKANSTAAYLETGKTLALGAGSHNGFAYSESANVTQYTAEGFVFTNMPGGTAEYTVVTSKSGYDVISVTPTKDGDGNWTIDVEMKYNPTNFDVKFTVMVDENLPEEYIPKAAIVKVTFWSTDRNRWEVITQQEENAPGVRVDLEPVAGDPTKYTGVGSYPVWMYESSVDGVNQPYYYRAMVSAFVYPDGTIVKTILDDNNVLEGNNIVEMTDGIYIAEVTANVPAGSMISRNGYTGVYYDGTEQIGELTIEIERNVYDVTFKGMGGTPAESVMFDQYTIPNLESVIPVREGYNFDGWYKDMACSIPAVEGEDLKSDIELYAKWVEQLRIEGHIMINFWYLQDGRMVYVNEIDRPTEVNIVLQEIRDGVVYDVDSQLMAVNILGMVFVQEFDFENVPNNGGNYRVLVDVLNYESRYNKIADKNYILDFNDAAEAYVSVELDFIPASADQKLVVDAEQIGAIYRPTTILAEIFYRDTGDTYPYQVISQHKGGNYGVVIPMDADGYGDGEESIWKWHTNGNLYDYLMNISKVDGVAFNSDTAPFYVIYSEPTYWNNATDSWGGGTKLENGDAVTYTGELQATLIPKQYVITFNLNADEDTVTGMESYWDATDNQHQIIHEWSHATEITAIPVREGYVFCGWEANVTGAYSENKAGEGTIDAGVQQDVVLTAKWSVPATTYTITTSCEGKGTVSGGGEYVVGDIVTVTATADVASGYEFVGWYENGMLVSKSENYEFEVTGDRTLVAKFKTYAIQVGVAPGDQAGSVTGAGNYPEGKVITLMAEAKAGWYFVGWYDENSNLISTDTVLSHTVVSSCQFNAHFAKKSEFKSNDAYIYGYNDTTMGGDGTLLRCEAAVMIYRLVAKNNNEELLNDFIANDQGVWFQNGMNYMVSKGVFAEDANPLEVVTRGEVFKMVALGLGFTTDSYDSNDSYGGILVDNGYIIGDGPSQVLNSSASMTRAEFCTMINRIIGRTGALLVDTNGSVVDADYYGYTDLDSNDDWYYYEVLRATSAYNDNGYVDPNKRGTRNDF